MAEYETAADEAAVTSRRFGPAYAALASQLRAERERQGLTQRALARRIEDYSILLCNWEKGRSVPGVAPLAKWAAGLGLELALVPVGTGAHVAELRAELAAANERAEKAEAELRENAEHIVLVQQYGAELMNQRDEARARLAKLGEATVEWTVPLDGENGSPLPEKLARRMATERWIPLMTRTAYREPPWRPAAETTDAAQNGRSATETSELQFDASAPATKPGGAQRGAQGLCESERNDETGTER